MADRNHWVEEILARRVSRRGFIARAGLAVGVPPVLMATLEACNTASSSSASASSSAVTDTLLIAVQAGDLRTLDPQDASELSTPLFLRGLYDQVTYWPGSTFSQNMPDAAVNWNVSADGLTWVFNLNPKIRFGDGTTLAPEDVAFSLLRLKNLDGPVAWFAGNVASADVTGPHQVTMKLSVIDVSTLYWLTSPFVSIGRASVMQAHGANDSTTASTTDTARTWLNNNSVGSGPFILDEWVVGSTITMHRNPYYWGAKPQFSHIVFELTADANTQRDMLERGDAHIAINLTPQLAASVSGNKDIKVVTVPSEGFPWLGLNVKNNPALSNPNNWLAIRNAIDYQALAKIYLNGGRPAAGIIPQGMAHALPVTDSTVWTAKNVAKAQAALAAAGNPSGFSFKMSYATDQYYSSVLSDDVAQRVASDLKAVGINATLNPLPAPEESTNFRAGILEASIHVWGADYLGWTDFLPNFCPGGNVADHRQAWEPSFDSISAQIANLTTEATQTTDNSKQESLCIQAQQLMNQHSPMVELFEMASLIGYRTDIIKSLNTNPVSYIEVDSVVLQ